jgi:transposase
MSKYTRSTKLEVAKRYLQGETAPDLSKLTHIPSRQIRYWAQVYRLNSEQAFLKRSKPYSAMEKCHILIKMVTERWSLGYTSAFYNLASPGILSTWHKQFLTTGLAGLAEDNRGRSMNSKKTSLAKSLEDLSLEELQEELKYLRAENAYLKKLDALLKEKRRQTQKKQGSSSH